MGADAERVRRSIRLMRERDSSDDALVEVHQRGIAPEIDARDPDRVGHALRDHRTTSPHAIERHADTKKSQAILADSRFGRNAALWNARSGIDSEPRGVAGADFLDAARGQHET